MAGWLSKRLVDLGLAEITEDEDKQAVPDEPQAPPPPPEVVAAPGPNPTPASPADPEAIKGLDEMVRSQLAAAMEGAGAARVERLEELLSTLKDSIPDETACYRTALKLMEKEGHTSPDILKDFDKCLAALAATEGQFLQQLDQQVASRVGGKHQEAERCQAEIDKRQSQIEQLQAEMSELGQQKYQAQIGAVEEQGKLDLAKARFGLAYKAISREVETHKAKVIKHVGGGASATAGAS